MPSFQRSETAPADMRASILVCMRRSEVFPSEASIRELRGQLFGIYHPLKMSAKRRSRLRPALAPYDKSAAGPGKTRNWLWKCFFILGVISLAAAGTWYFLGREDRVLAEIRVPPARPQSHPTADARADDQERAFLSLMSQASELLDQGRPAEAVERLTNALKLKPTDEDVHYNLAMAFARLGKTNEAELHYNEALKILPSYAEAHNNLGNLLMRADRIDEAIDHFNQAIRTMPDYASAHNNLGTALQKAGRVGDALQHFQEAVKLAPNYWQAHFNLGMSCLQAGRQAEAKTAFETVLRLQPVFQPAKAALADMEIRSRATGSAAQ